MIYPNLNGIGDWELLKLRTKEDQMRKLLYKTGKHNHENLLKSFKIDNGFYWKKV